MRKIILLNIALLGLNFQAQTKKLGINTDRPTEVLDVNGTLRIKDVPVDNTTNVLYNGGSSKNLRFTGTNVLLTDANGNLGKADNKDLVPNKNYTGFNALDNSTAIFVTRQYTVKDWPSGQDGGLGFNTGMSTSKWEAIFSNVSYKLSERYSTSREYPYTSNNVAINEFLTKLFGSEGSISSVATFGWTLGKNNGTWRIVGDFDGIREQNTLIDILFINKNYVATDRP